MNTNIGQRQLAAIVFTDVVGFSAKAATDEINTIRRVSEDLELLKSHCTRRNGKIIKTTGDGLLISFASAIDAVSFAVEAQKKLSMRNEALSADNRLEHRMGIHLGDIFLSESDAMGDGVNIAARLQSEAEPGGICVSQTVYNVVKNKLAIKAVSIGPRELKNIREAIYAYRIIVDAESNLAGKSAAGGTIRAKNRKLLFFSVIVAAAVIVFLAVYLIGFRGWGPGETYETGSRKTPDRIKSIPLSEKQRERNIERIRSALARQGSENPLIVRIPRRAPRGFGPARPVEVAVWMEGDEVVIKHGDRVRRTRIEQLGLRMFRAICMELNRKGI